MSERDHYPPGVPCWVETLQADPRVAMDFYAMLFGWEFAGPGDMPGDESDGYYVARLGGRDVAGIGSMAARGAPRTPTWTTYVRVDSASDAAARAIEAAGNVLVEPLDAPPAGTLAILADPTGAPFGVWEAEDRQGAQRVNEASAWSISTLSTNDLERAAAFYGDMFGWRTDAFGDPAAGARIIRLPGYVGGEPRQPVPRDTVGLIVPARPDAPHPARWSVDFWIDDVDGAAARTAAAGGQVIAQPFDMGNFRTAVLTDPAGAAFSISQLMRGR
jgi:predicted enzyme related to lactoylglutathione lyase